MPINHEDYLTPSDGEFDLDIEHIWDEFVLDKRPSASTLYVVSESYDKITQNMMDKEDLTKLFNIEIGDGLTLETPSVIVDNENYYCYDTLTQFREVWSNIIAKEFLSEGEDLKDNNLVKMAIVKKPNLFQGLELLPQNIKEIAFRMTELDVFFEVFDYWMYGKAFEDKGFIIFWE